MDTNPTRIQELIDRPVESLSVELKRWIDPVLPEGASKIVRTALALRNHGGGYLVIGFDNKTLQPDIGNVPNDVKSAFHIDKIQGLVARFASEPFEITVEFPERDGQPYPVIIIPPGVKTPVASKSELLSSETKLISTGDVYVRSLQSNNTPSTTKAGWKDWPKIVEVCFDNREADIGRFLRRHLGGMTPEIFYELASIITKGTEPKVTTEELLKRHLQECNERYNILVQERSAKLPEHGSWEVSLLLIGDIPKHSASPQFLNLLESNNPNYTGWPVWLDSRNFKNSDARPHLINEVWESLLISLDSGWSNNVDFIRLDPKGRFYLRRALEDDISNSKQAPKNLSILDFALPIIRTAEALAVGTAFAKAMGCTPESTLLAFAFRWTKLRNRMLGSWTKPGSYISPGKLAYQDEVLTFVSLPLETSLSALGEFVYQGVQPLFQVFDGFSIDKNIVGDLTRRLVERKF